jgi:hypothetical protein
MGGALCDDAAEKPPGDGGADEDDSDGGEMSEFHGKDVMRLS